jgi:hypothetical protein
MVDSAINWLFVDLNSYFASIEQELCPELRGQPIAIVGYGNDSAQNGPFGVASSDGISQCWVWAYNATASLQPSSNFQKSRLAGP